ncbi:GNAT family N-acetyltransferase [Alteromonas aquimaris]|uniref:GNAT family N-acetyltransferase n=1 Tax=Alteromonas aquimaris TaxID=2998417 RepID=UPI00387EADAF
MLGLAVINLESYYKGRANGFVIERLYVHPSFRNNGIGRAIITFISDKLGRSFWLYTWVENASNSFYERLGFKRIGTHHFYFGQHEIANYVYARSGF